MSKKSLFAWIISLIIILIIASPAAAGTDRSPVSPSPLLKPSVDHQVAITDLGFVPAELNIEVGDSVTWTNQKTVPVSLQEGSLSYLYLPAVLKPGAGSALLPPAASSPLSPGSDPIPPGGTLTIFFNDVGVNDFYLEGVLYGTGTIIVGPKPPNLEVRSITYDPDPAVYNGTTTLTAEVHNLGLGPANGFFVDWKVFKPGQANPILTGSWEVTHLSAGGHILLEASFTAPTPGAYTIQVIADPSGELPDTNPLNNIKETELGVSGTVMFCGYISANTTWAYATYVIKPDCGPFVILSGATLTVRSGAVVKPQPGVGIGVYGSLVSQGDDPTFVAFTSYNDDSFGGDTNGDGGATTAAPGDWNGITIFPGGLVDVKQDTFLRFGAILVNNQGGTFKIHQSTMDHANSNAIHSTDNGVIDITGCQIHDNGGHGLYYAASGTVSPRIRDTTFQSNTGYAAIFSPSGDLELDGTELANNTALNNGTNGLRITGTLIGSSTLGSLGFPYVLEDRIDLGSIYVPAGSTLTILPGAAFKMLSYTDLYDENGTGLEIAGTLSAVGTADAPIIFTSIYDDAAGGDTNNDGVATVPAAGLWTRHLIDSGGAATFEYAEIRYSGGALYNQTAVSILNAGGSLVFTNSEVDRSGGIGIRSVSNGTIDVEDSLIQNNASHGLYYSASGSVMPVVQGSTFQSNQGYAVYFEPSGDLNLDGTQMSGNIAQNNAYNGLRLVGTLTGSSTLSASLGFPYVLEDRIDLGSIYVPAGSTLTIQPGAVLKMLSYGDYYDENGTGLEIAGTLSAVGTAEEPIIFTSIYDDAVGGDTNNDGAATSPAAGQWTRHRIDSGGSATFEYVEIRYSGGPLYVQTAVSILNAGGSLVFRNSEVDRSGGIGIFSVSNGTIDVENSLIQNSSNHGLYYSASGSVEPVVQGSTFQSNQGYAVYFDPSGDLNLDGTQMSGNIAQNNNYNGLRLVGTLTGISTLSGSLGFPYVLEDPNDLGSIYVPAGSTLTIQPGAVFKMHGYADLYDENGTGLEIAGTLSAVGTADAPIVFTSIYDDAAGGDTNNDGATSPAPGQWTRHRIDSGGTATFEHVEIRYSGGVLNNQTAVSILNAGGSLVFRNSEVDRGAGIGIFSFSNGVIDVEDSLIQNNAGHGLFYEFSGSAEPVILNTGFLTNTGYAVYFSVGTDVVLDTSQVSGNTASNNSYNGLRLVGTLTGASTLSAGVGFPYVLEDPNDLGSIYVPSGSTLTIQPGAVFKMHGYADLYDENGTGLEIAGTLSAVGTADAPIIFTSIFDDAAGGDTNNDGVATVPEAGQWTRHRIDSGGTATFEHVEIRYSGGVLNNQTAVSILNAGGSLVFRNSEVDRGAGIGIFSFSNGVIDVEDSLIQNNAGHGLFYEFSGSAEPVILNTGFLTNTGYAVYFSVGSNVVLDTSQVVGNTAANNSYNGLRLVGTLTGASTLSAGVGFPYVLEDPNDLGSIYVPSGSTLTIQPGAVFKMHVYGDYYDENGTGLEIAGTLSAVGTADAPIIFTSIFDDAAGGDTNNDGVATVPEAGQWTRHRIDSGGSATFEYVEIRYSGGPLYVQTAVSILNTGGSLVFTNSEVDRSGGIGIRSVSDGTIDVENSLIQNNAGHGLFYEFSGSAEPVILNTGFLTNTGYAVYFSVGSNVVLDTSQVVGNTAANNSYNGLRLVGTLTGASTLSAGVGFPYVLEDPNDLGSIYVPSGSTLTIQPGAVFKMHVYGDYYDENGTGLEIAGTLSAVGTADAPIIFTSIFDDAAGGDTNNDGVATVPEAGQWTRHRIDSGGTATFEHVEIRYSGGVLYNQTQESILNNGDLTLLNSFVDASPDVGVRINGGSLDAESSTFAHTNVGVLLGNTPGAASLVDCDFLSNNTGLYFNGTVAPTVTNAIFEGNASYGLYNNAAPAVVATGCWWEDATGPYNAATNPTGLGDPVSNNVDFSSWLSTRPR